MNAPIERIYETTKSYIFDEDTTEFTISETMIPDYIEYSLRLVVANNYDVGGNECNLPDPLYMSDGTGSEDLNLIGLNYYQLESNLFRNDEICYCNGTNTDNPVIKVYNYARNKYTGTYSVRLSAVGGGVVNHGSFIFMIKFHRAP
jgi:hypothetical protein